MKNRNFFICATDLAVITGTNPYRDIKDIYIKLWKKYFNKDYIKYINYLKSKNIKTKKEETSIECIKRIAIENNLDLKKDINLDSALNTNNTEELNNHRDNILKKIKNKIPKNVSKEFNESFNSVINTNFGIKYESKGCDLYHNKTGNIIILDRTYHKKSVFDIDTNNDFVNCNDIWHLGGKVDAITEIYKESEKTKCIIEIKNRVNRLFYTLKEYEKVQCYVYMFLLDIQKTHLCEILKSKDKTTLNIIEIEFDDIYWDNILNKTEEFINDFYDFMGNKKRKIELIKSI